MADILSQLYLASAALKHYHDQGDRPEDLPLLRWVCEDSLYTIQQSFDGLFKNLPNRYISFAVRLIVFPLGMPYRKPSDRLEHELAEILLKPSAARDRLTAGMYMPQDISEKVKLLDEALRTAVETRPLRKKLHNAAHHKLLHQRGAAQVTEAVEKGLLTVVEAEALRSAESLRRQVIQVDDFPSLKG
jgi:acyl-CoA dehydrogenase